MTTWLKGKVSQDKFRMKEDGYNLDLTYITERMLAMAWPAEKFVHKIWRNSINDVSRFLAEKHGKNYWVFNVSGFPYDTTPFNDQVSLYEWEDHHSPTLLVLFEACRKMHEFLMEKEENVAIVHCNAGKGRTGTLICCYFLFCGFADTA